MAAVILSVNELLNCLVPYLAKYLNAYIGEPFLRFHWSSFWGCSKLRCPNHSCKIYVSINIIFLCIVVITNYSHSPVFCVMFVFLPLVLFLCSNRLCSYVKHSHLQI